MSNPPKLTGEYDPSQPELPPLTVDQEIELAEEELYKLYLNEAIKYTERYKKPHFNLPESRDVFYKSPFFTELNIHVNGSDGKYLVNPIKKRIKELERKKRPRTPITNEAAYYAVFGQPTGVPPSYAQANPPPPNYQLNESFVGKLIASVRNNLTKKSPPPPNYSTGSSRIGGKKKQMTKRKRMTKRN